MIFPVIAAAAAAAVPATADMQDLRCVAAFAAMSNFATKQDDKTKLLAGMLYYIGKLDGRSPGFDLDGQLTLLVDQPDYVTRQLGGDVERCAEEVKQRGNQLEAIGGAMKRGA